jgi:hypothetical protein
MLSKEALIAKVLVENDIDPGEIYLAKDENAHLRSGGYADVIVAEMRHNRLPNANRYFTCDDFACFDVKCDDLCHSHYSHYDSWIVTLADGSFAWVCDPLKDLLTRQIDDMRREKGTPVRLLLDSIFGGAEPSVPLLQNHPDRESTAIYDLELPSSLEAGGIDYDYLGHWWKLTKLPSRTTSSSSAVLDTFTTAMAGKVQRYKPSTQLSMG